MPSSSNNPVVRSLQLLTTGWGYNFYNDANKARADDLLVREKASHRLGEATNALSALEVAFRRQFVPPSTRDQPYPPADVMEKLRAIGALKTRVSDLSVRLRGASAPTQDKIWFRFREERTLLDQLLCFDEGMISGTAEIAELARTLTAAAWNADPADAAAPFDEALDSLNSSLRQRNDLLLMPTF